MKCHFQRIVAKGEKKITQLLVASAVHCCIAMTYSRSQIRRAGENCCVWLDLTLTLKVTHSHCSTAHCLKSMAAQLGPLSCSGIAVCHAFVVNVTAPLCLLFASDVPCLCRGRGQLPQYG